MSSSLRSARMAVHFSLVGSGRGSSHVNLVSQTSCSSILALILTGITRPKGSWICGDLCHMSHLIINVLTSGSFRTESDSISVAVFQLRPRSPTVVLGSLFCLLLVDQNLRLNLACPIRVLD